MWEWRAHEDNGLPLDKKARKKTEMQLGVSLPLKYLRLFQSPDSGSAAWNAVSKSLLSGETSAVKHKRRRFIAMHGFGCENDLKLKTV